MHGALRAILNQIGVPKYSIVVWEALPRCVAKNEDAWTHKQLGVFMASEQACKLLGLCGLRSETSEFCNFLSFSQLASMSLKSPLLHPHVDFQAARGSSPVGAHRGQEGSYTESCVSCSLRWCYGMQAPMPTMRNLAQGL